jgi:hypothetical protein
MNEARAAWARNSASCVAFDGECGCACARRLRTSRKADESSERISSSALLSDVSGRSACSGTIVTIDSALSRWNKRMDVKFASAQIGSSRKRSNCRLSWSRQSRRFQPLPRQLQFNEGARKLSCADQCYVRAPGVGLRVLGRDRDTSSCRKQRQKCGHEFLECWCESRLRRVWVRTQELTDTRRVRNQLFGWHFPPLPEQSHLGERTNKRKGPPSGRPSIILTALGAWFTPHARRGRTPGSSYSPAWPALWPRCSGTARPAPPCTHSPASCRRFPRRSCSR